MTITTKTEGTTATIYVEGWLDTQSSPDLGKEVEGISEARARSEERRVGKECM